MGWLAGWAKLVELGWLGWAWMGWLAAWAGLGWLSWAGRGGLGWAFLIIVVCLFVDL